MDAARAEAKASVSPALTPNRTLPLRVPLSGLTSGGRGALAHGPPAGAGQAAPPQGRFRPRPGPQAAPAARPAAPAGGGDAAGAAPAAKAPAKAAAARPAGPAPLVDFVFAGSAPSPALPYRLSSPAGHSGRDSSRGPDPEVEEVRNLPDEPGVPSGRVPSPYIPGQRPSIDNLLHVGQACPPDPFFELGVPRPASASSAASASHLPRGPGRPDSARPGSVPSAIEEEQAYADETFEGGEEGPEEGALGISETHVVSGDFSELNLGEDEGGEGYPDAEAAGAAPGYGDAPQWRVSEPEPEPEPEPADPSPWPESIPEGEEGDSNDADILRRGERTTRLLGRREELRRAVSTAQRQCIDLVNASVFWELYGLFKRRADEEEMGAGDGGELEAFIGRRLGDRGEVITKLYHILFCEEELRETEAALSRA
eukprot:tig00020830_g14422.t1